MSSVFTANINLEEPANGDDINTWNNPLNSNFTVIDQAIGTTANQSLTGSNVTLTTAQSAFFMFNLTGTLSTNVSLIFPVTKGGLVFINNNCTGNFAVTVKNGASDAGVAVSQAVITPVVLNAANAATLSSSVVPGAIFGLVLSNDGVSPNTVIDISAGSSSASDNTVTMTSGAFTKTTGSWAAGTGNGGLDTGSVAASTWYSVYQIKRTDTNAVDFLLSTSATSPTMPASYTKRRRIGSIRTNASSQIIAFTQFGNDFVWKVAPTDINAAVFTTSVLRTLTVPTGVVVTVNFRYSVFSSVNGYILFQSPDETAATPSTSTGYTSASGNVNTVGGTSSMRTNTSAQIRVSGFASSGSTSMQLSTYGWTDTRGIYQ